MGTDTFSYIDSDWLRAHSRVLAVSYKRYTGQDLVDNKRPDLLARKLFAADFVLVSHDGTEDPILNYGNKRALELWQMSWSQFITTPSRYTAEPDNQKARKAMLDKAKVSGLITDYNGIRISSSGRRFMIKNATIWTFIPQQDGYAGQAAMFRDWQFLD